MAHSGPAAPFEAEVGRYRMGVRRVSYGFVAALASLLIVSMGATVALRLTVSRSVIQLSTHWVPAQTSAVSLLAAYVDEETGNRGFLLAGTEQFVARLEQGGRTARRLQTRLDTLLKGDRRALAELRRVAAAHLAWQALADEQIAARRSGPLTPGQLKTMALQGKQRFDTLRARLAALTYRVDRLATAELNRVNRLNTDANLVSIAAAALTLAAALLAVPALRRVLVRPLEVLIGRIERVAGGDYEESIPPQGPVELAAIAEAVERMRQSMLQSTDDLVAARQELTLLNERERIAADLHDLTIQRLFVLGLALSAEASREGDTARLGPLIDETDRIIRELRGVIFGMTHDPADSLRAGVGTVVHESARALGFTPAVEIRGPVDHAPPALAEELLAVLREALSNVVRHARATSAAVLVAFDGDSLYLSVTDDGAGLPKSSIAGGGTRNMAARAARLGGHASIAGRADGGGTTVEWRVPLGDAP